MRQVRDWLHETEQLRKAVARNKLAVQTAAAELGVPWVTVRMFIRLGVDTNPTVHTLQILELLLLRISEQDAPPPMIQRPKRRKPRKGRVKS